MTDPVGSDPDQSTAAPSAVAAPPAGSATHPAPSTPAASAATPRASAAAPPAVTAPPAGAAAPTAARATPAECTTGAISAAAGGAPAPEVVAVVGATGTGKSELALALAERFAAAGRPAEIVNADAMQLYRGMDIGTAKLSVAERRGIPHHMLDVLDVTADGSVADYQRDARAAIDGIIARGAVPLVVGGSGLYVSSVIFDFRFPVRDEAVRAALEAELEEVGLEALWQRLSASDAEAAASIGRHNARRVVRALEVIELTGKPVTGQLPEETVWWRPTAIVALQHPRELLVERLDRRVETMWRAGLVDEVAALVPQGLERATTARRAIGYAQALAQLRGAQSEGEAIAEAQALTRRYARRQVSWFRRYREARWFDSSDASLVENAWAGIRMPQPQPTGA